MGKKLRVGDLYTIEGVYAARSFFQWLFRRPRHLQVFVVTESDVTSDGQLKFDSPSA